MWTLVILFAGIFLMIGRSKGEKRGLNKFREAGRIKLNFHVQTIDANIIGRRSIKFNSADVYPRTFYQEYQQRFMKKKKREKKMLYRSEKAFSRNRVFCDV